MKDVLGLVHSTEKHNKINKISERCSILHHLVWNTYSIHYLHMSQNMLPVNLQSYHKFILSISYELSFYKCHSHHMHTESAIYRPNYLSHKPRRIIPSHNFVHKQVCYNPEVNHTQMNPLANQHICDKTPIC